RREPRLRGARAHHQRPAGGPEQPLPGGAPAGDHALPALHQVAEVPPGRVGRPSLPVGWHAADPSARASPKSCKRIALWLGTAVEGRADATNKRRSAMLRQILRIGTLALLLLALVAPARAEGAGEHAIFTG